MNVAPALTNVLLADTPTIALVSNRIYPEYDRQANKTYPLIAYKVENVSPLTANDGVTGFETADYVVACIGETYASTDAVAGCVQTALDGQRGTWSGVSVQGVFLKTDGITEETLTEPGTELILYYITTLTFEVAYSRP